MMGRGIKGIPSKKTIAEIVRRRLEAEIIAGTHPPETHLDETEMAEWQGCSRTPLREAFNQLVAVGLLERRPHCGVYVQPLMRGHAQALAEACGELDALCAVLAAERLSVATRHSLENWNSNDHSALWLTVRHGCGNPCLAEQADMLAMKLRPYRLLVGEVACNHFGHAAPKLALAVASGDGPAASSIARGHWRELGDAAAAVLSA